MSPFWSAQIISTSVCAGLRELSKLIVAVWTFFNSALSELEQISLSASSTLNSSSAIFGGREENPCWNPSAGRTSQLMEGPKVAINVEQVSSCLSFLCNSSLQRENMTSHISELLRDAAIISAINLKLMPQATTDTKWLCPYMPSVIKKRSTTLPSGVVDTFTLWIISSKSDSMCVTSADDTAQSVLFQFHSQSSR